MKLTKAHAIGAALAIGFGLTGAGVAYASIPDSGTGVLTACRVTGDAGNVRIIDKQGGASCHSYETEISWDTTPGLSGRQIVSNTGTVGWLGKTTVSATCPSGKVAVGGGFESSDTGNHPEFEVYWSKPVTSGGTSSWDVRTNNLTGGTITVTAYAVCVSE